MRQIFVAICIALVAGCQPMRPQIYRPGDPSPRVGDEIVVAGQFFHTGTPVVTWLDPGGYDGYRIEKRFPPTTQIVNNVVAAAARYGVRDGPTTRHADEWDLSKLRLQIDQFVIHFDVSGVSRECFRTLHDERGLSVHFLIDIDGTIYQTLDVKERAYHATISNNRSVGVELANVGAYPTPDAPTLKRWYVIDANGEARITIPETLGDGGVRTPNFVGRPARRELVHGTVQGQSLFQYDFTPQQYEALAHLSATLCRVLPRIACDVPRDADGQVIDRKLDDVGLANFHGLLGHFHIQLNKVDPGPAMNWDSLLRRTKQLSVR